MKNKKMKLIKRWKAKIVNNKIVINKPKLWNDNLQLLEGKDVSITIEKWINKRTDAQNRALHLYFTLLAEELNNHGLDMKSFLKVDISWSPLMVKELLWRPLQKIHLGKESTTKLTTENINQIYDILNRVIIERSKGNIQITFPSIEELFKENY